jgi:hypothetical protein
MMLRILIGVALLVACAGPGRARSYTAGYGTGNVIDSPLLEKTNGRYGYCGSVALRSGDSQSVYSSVGTQGTSVYAYSPNKRGSMQSRHRDHSHQRFVWPYGRGLSSPRLNPARRNFSGSTALPLMRVS